MSRIKKVLSVCAFTAAAVGAVAHPAVAEAHGSGPPSAKTSAASFDATSPGADENHGAAVPGENHGADIPGSEDNHAAGADDSHGAGG